MTKPSEQDVIGGRVPRDETQGLGLFDAVRAPVAQPVERVKPPRSPRSIERPQSDADRAREEAIVKVKSRVVEELLRRAQTRVDVEYSPGVVSDDVRQLAEGLPYAALLGRDQRAWSWVGPWLAQLEREGALAVYRHSNGDPVRRKSARKDAHGNMQIVYLDPRDHRAGRRAA